MPVPKKKRVAPNPVKPGILKQFLDANYFDIPSTADELQNGHVLYLYLKNERSVSKSVEHLTEKFGCRVNFNAVKKIEKQFMKFKKPSDPVEFGRFQSLCRTTTTISDTVSVPSVSNSAVVADFSSVLASDTSCHGDDRTISSVRPHVNEKCENCDTIKQRLNLTLQRHVEVRRRHLELCRNLRNKLKQTQSQSVKRLNQTIKRKQSQLAKAKLKSANESLILKLKKTQLELQKLKKNEQRRKVYNANKRPTSCECTLPDVVELEEKIKFQNARIIELENEKVILEEKDSVSPFNKDGKVFNNTTRMFVYDAIVNQVPTNNIPNLLQKLVSDPDK